MALMLMACGDAASDGGDVAEDQGDADGDTEPDEPAADADPAKPESEPEGVRRRQLRDWRRSGAWHVPVRRRRHVLLGAPQGLSGDLDEVSANGNNAPEIVALTKKDVGFESRGCGKLIDVKGTAPAKPATEFGDGTYQVGVHIPPGTYRSDGEDMCYWARLNDFTDDLEAIGQRQQLRHRRDQPGRRGLHDVRLRHLDPPLTPTLAKWRIAAHRAISAVDVA